MKTASSSSCACLVRDEVVGTPGAPAECIKYSMLPLGSQSCYGVKQDMEEYSQVGMGMAWCLAALCLVMLITGSCQAWTVEMVRKDKRKVRVKK